MTSDEGRVDGNGPKRFSLQRKVVIVARLLRGEPLDLVARQTNVSIARLTEWRDRDDRDDESERNGRSKVGCLNSPSRVSQHRAAVQVQSRTAN